MKNAHLLFVPLIAILLYGFAPASWIDYTSKEGKFKIKFPKQPAYTTGTAGDADAPLKMHFFICDTKAYKDENVVYYVMYSDYPKEMANSDFKDEIVEGCIQGAAKKANGTIISTTKNNTYKGVAGRNGKFSIQDGDGICNVKIFLVRNRLYMLMAICESQNDNNQSMDKFFSSFALLDSPKK